MSEKHIGEVVQVIGPVLDIRFAHDELPALLNAIEIESNGAKLTAEVAQQIGDDVVRCIARIAISPPILLQTTRSTSPSKSSPSGVPIRKGKVLIRHLLYCFLAFSNTSSMVPANRK